MTAHTAKFLFPYPEAADANNVPADMEALAQAIEDAIASAMQGNARPAAGTSGRFYFNTTTHVLSYDDGTTWWDIYNKFPPYFSVHRGATAQNLVSGTLTHLVGFATDQNDGAAFSSGSSRFVVPTNWAGIWEFDACVHFSGPQANPHIIELLVNGGTTIYVASAATGAGFSTTGLILNGSRRIRLNVGDYVELWARQESGSDQDCLTPEWTGTWVRP